MECLKLTVILSSLALLLGLLIYIAGDDHGVSKIASTVDKTPTLPQIKTKLKHSDLIYHTRNDSRNYIPVVNEEYKTVFFFIGKCATSEWKRMFVRMMGSPEWCTNRIHDKETNQLKWLDDFPQAEAQRMMTSPEWTRAVFVRNPKERLLSAFLDKAVQHSGHFVNGPCRVYDAHGGDVQECIDNHQEFRFFLRRIITTMPTNVHWMQIYDQIDEKWWPYINFVGNMETLGEDAETLLRSIVSDKDGLSAWEHWGKTGWGSDEHDCTSKGTKPFLAEHDPVHETDAHTKLRKYYNPVLEMFVEKLYSKDLDNPYFQFSPIELFPHDYSAEREGGS